MNTQALVKLRNYWDDLRDGRIAPYRAEIDPRAFEDVLPHMFILEQLNPQQVRVRLGGQALCEMMGMEVRGMPPEAFIDAAHRTWFHKVISDVLGQPAVAELDLSTVDTHGREMAGQMLLLPLRSDFGEVSRVLGCVVAERSQVRAPVNFEIKAARVVEVNGADAAGEPDAPEPLPGFASDQAPFQWPTVREVHDNPNAETGQPRRGHLRLIKSS